MNPRRAPPPPDDLAAAARRSSERAIAGARDPEPSLASRLGQIGVLGWTIVVPLLAGLALGRMVDRALGTHALFTAPLIGLGAAAGLWLAWRWMRRQP